MPEILQQGSRGEEVRRLQINLNAAIGRRYGYLNTDGKFGPLTKQAVERYQRDFKLKFIDGIVGPETRNALATRIFLIEGTMSRTETQPQPPTPPPQPPTPPPHSHLPRRRSRLSLRRNRASYCNYSRPLG
jgi:peptidoglycan hydrolase-like protein with peptidoglycan-binding domain